MTPTAKLGARRQIQIKERSARLRGYRARHAELCQDDLKACRLPRYPALSDLIRAAINEGLAEYPPNPDVSDFDYYTIVVGAEFHELLRGRAEQYRVPLGRFVARLVSSGIEKLCEQS